MMIINRFVNYLMYLIGNGCTQSIANGLNWLNTYLVITLGDLSTSADIRNRAIICGSFTSGTSATFAADAGNTITASTDYTVQLNGNMAGGGALNINEGSFGVGTNPAHTIVQNANQFTLDGRMINIEDFSNGAVLNVDNTIATKCQSITSSLQALTQYLNQLPDTPGNTMTVPTNTNGPLNFNVNAVGSNGVSVFHIDGNTAWNNGLVQQISVIVSAAVSANVKLVVINLTGTSISFNQGNLLGDWLNSATTGQAHTIWNFPSATTITLGRSVLGAILAPYATLSNSAVINGAVAVLSFQGGAAVTNPLLVLPACI
jgi:hypothetical protein